MVSLKTNIIELQRVNPAPFSSDLILCKSDWLKTKRLYLLPGSTTKVGNVPLGNVIGHVQPMYPSMEWGECLSGKHLKRIRGCLDDLDKNPDYYLDSANTKDMSFIKIGDDYLLETGKHRLITARFFFHFNAQHLQNQAVLKNVEITEMQPDHEFMAFKAALESESVHYPDLKYDWHYERLHINEGCLYVYNRKKKTGIWYRRSDLPSLINHLKRPSLLKKWRNERTHRLITVKECFHSMGRAYSPLLKLFDKSM